MSDYTDVTIDQIRDAMRAKFGARKYRITKADELHVYGKMPNSNAVGWYLYGYVHDAITMLRLGLID